LQDSISEISNVFSPNNDGRNDCLAIGATGNYNWLYFTIYNRWGLEIYSSRDRDLCWDGNSEDGAPVSSGNYFFILEAESACGEKISRRGSIYLVR